MTDHLRYIWQGLQALFWMTLFACIFTTVGIGFIYTLIYAIGWFSISWHWIIFLVLVIIGFCWFFGWLTDEDKKLYKY